MGHGGLSSCWDKLWQEQSRRHVLTWTRCLLSAGTNLHPQGQAGTYPGPSFRTVHLSVFSVLLFIYLHACRSFCLSDYRGLSFCSPVGLSICLSVSVKVCLSFLSFCLSLCPGFATFMRTCEPTLCLLHVFLFVCLSSCLSVCLSVVCLSISTCVFLYLFACFVSCLSVYFLSVNLSISLSVSLSSVSLSVCLAVCITYPRLQPICIFPNLK